jgi:nitrogen fixation NifU-like protein
MSENEYRGGTTGGVDDLYREVILDHFKSPRNKGKITSPTVSNEGANPLCGDEIEITALVTDGVLEDLKFTGHGCAISQSSASMMTEALKGKSVKEVLSIVNQFKGLLLPGGAGDAKPIDLGDLETLEGVKKYPMRVKCATLAWNTLSDALKNYSPKR